MFGSLLIKFKSALLTLAAVLFVLVGAYTLGGSAARRSIKEKTREEEKRRLQRTVDIKNETVNEIRRKDASAVHRELYDKWLRD
ncbi:TPA: hypothetical protein L3438_003793 [Escherichia coli]|nr:hypothetical protein [Escherichia coli]